MKEQFIKTISALNKAADIMMQNAHNKRIPEVCILRAMRTMIDVNCEYEIKYDSDEELVEETKKLAKEFVQVFPVNADFIISRNNCFPPLTGVEKDAIAKYITKIKNTNHVE